MALNQPTIEEIYQSLIDGFELFLNQTTPLLPKAFNRVVAKSLAAVVMMLFKYGGFIFLQLFVSQATIKETTIFGRKLSPLIEWGRLIGVGDPTPGTNAELLIDITVENQIGSLPASTQLTSNQNGFIYVTKESVLLDSDIVQAEIIAVNDDENQGGVGVLGNLDPGDIVSFVNPQANVARDAVVDSQVVTAANAESEDAYRQRVIDRFQKKPQGGASADYEQWGEEVPGIINVYPYTSETPGIVNVYSEATVASSGSADGIPTQAQLDAVKESIEKDENGLATRRPITAFVESLPITRTGFDVKISNLVVQDEATVKAEILSNLTSFFLDREPYVDGLTIPPRKDKISINTIIGIIDDSVSNRNGTFSDAFLFATGSPISLDLYYLDEGEKAKLVNLTYIS